MFMRIFQISSYMKNYGTPWKKVVTLRMKNPRRKGHTGSIPVSGTNDFS